MTDLAASLGLSQLKRMIQILERRHQVIDSYLRNGTIRAHAYCLHRGDSVISNGFTFTVLLPGTRNAVQRALQAKGVETRAMWPVCVDEEPVYRQRYDNQLVGSLDTAREFSRSCLSLPVHCGLKRTDVDHIISAFESFAP